MFAAQQYHAKAIQYFKFLEYSIQADQPKALRWSMLVPDRELFIRHQDPSLTPGSPWVRFQQPRGGNRTSELARVTTGLMTG
jgi:hypothetical protein